MLELSVLQEIYQVVRMVPAGKVATYGQIAALIGKPRHSRHVGHALNALDGESDLPWHRVVNSQGKISQRTADNSSENLQRQRLEQEGITFKNERLSLKQYQWQP